jgi:hypothetical protein
MGRRLLVICLGLLGLTSFLSPQNEREASPAMEVMWRKLDLSHDALDALALEDFEALEAYASDPVSLSDAAREFIPDSEAYRDENRELRRAASNLGRAARFQDVDAAALAYMELTLGCVGCHRMLGGVPRR